MASFDLAQANIVGAGAAIRFLDLLIVALLGGVLARLCRERAIGVRH